MRVLCLYIPRLPVRLAERQRPELEGQEVVMVTGAGADGLVSACSGAAACGGVVVGMAAGEARRLAPGAMFLPDNATTCLDELERLAGIIRARVTPLVEAGGRDHLFVDLGSLAEPPDGAQAVGERIRQLVAAWSGFEVRAGLGPDRRQALAAARKARRLPLAFDDDAGEAEAPIRSRAGEVVAAGATLHGGPQKKRATALALLSRLGAVMAARGESFRELSVVVTYRNEVRPLRAKVKPGSDTLSAFRGLVGPDDLDDADAIRVELGALGPDLAILPYAGGATVAPIGFSRRATRRGAPSPVPLLAAG